MISPSYSINELLEQIKDMDWPAMRDAVSKEGREAERRSEKGIGADEAVRRGSREYARILRGLAFFLQGGGKPAGVSDSEFQLFRPVCERLVEKGQFKPETLELFGEQEEPGSQPE